MLDGILISLLLSQLAGKLKVHAIAEDRFLYPALMNHTNPKVTSVPLRNAGRIFAGPPRIHKM